MNPLNPRRETPQRSAPPASPTRSSRTSAPFPPVGPSAPAASSPALPTYRRPGRAVRSLATVAALLLIPLAVFAGGDGFRAALDFTTGVLSLVALTASVMWGLVASDRLFLRSRQRLLAQAVHRGTAIAAVGFLLLHGTVKLALDHVSFVGALVPFGLGVTGGDGLIGLGSLAGLLMITTSVTGALRSAFVSPVQVASRWRALHMLAYPAWCAALIHGLYAGRAPKPWVVALYCLCLLAVAGAVALRAAPLPVKRKVAAQVFALLEPDERPAPSGSRRRESSAPAWDTASTPLPGTASGRFAAAPPDQHPVSGMAAAYRALATPSGHDTDLPPDLQPTEALPTVTPRWPTPSPPPPAEAPTASLPHLSVDSGYASVENGYVSVDSRYAPVDSRYDFPDSRYAASAGRYGSVDVGDDTLAGRYGHQDTRHDYYGDRGSSPAADPYATGPQPLHQPPAPGPPPPPSAPPPAQGGPGTQQLLGPFQAPSTGEPWNAPTGGSK
ncbi:cytochrome b/b6 domain-containing protein [Streptomyces typhae]|uniref:cytochrome b/b6 domain-containing protein n=1 Tax=Streptomyces typhae TaxID=2681492 RepID=UPI001FEBAC3E|nr:cytochrome b/b6 domain-containing protein [Streptomyces typhae]